MRLSIYDFLRIGHIKRWHNVNTTREQTVAEHSYMVGLIALHLFCAMTPKGDGFKEAVAVLVVGSMFDDAPEAAAGDTPTPAKRLMCELTKDPDLFKKLDSYLMPHIPYIGGSVSAHLQRFIKMADTIEAYHFIHNNGAGPHAKIVEMGARRRLEDRAMKFDEEEPDAGWIKHINDILVQMGLPYIHKESRMSPP